MGVTLKSTPPRCFGFGFCFFEEAEEEEDAPPFGRPMALAREQAGLSRRVLGGVGGSRRWRRAVGCGGGGGGGEKGNDEEWRLETRYGPSAVKIYGPDRNDMGR